MRRFACLVSVLLMMTGFALNAAENPWSPQRGQETLDSLRAAMAAESSQFYSPKLHAWYSTKLTNLPSAEEVIDLYPNPVGYGTGMDDNPLFNGVLLVALVDLFHLTGSDAVRNEAFDIYTGLKLCGSAHGIPGFVARGVCIEDGKSVYITSSRDQYTHYVDGLWQYYHSPMCNDETKKEIRTLLSQLADTMKREIIPENDYGYLRADGSKDPRGLHKMWHVYSHEAARLPMIYAAAWDVTGNKDYYQLYRKYLDSSLDQSIALKTRPKSEVNSWVPPYSFFQMQCSLSLLYRLEKDAAMKAKIFEAMTVAKDMAETKLDWASRRGLRDMAELLLAMTIIEDLPVTETQRQRIDKLFAPRHLQMGGPPTTLHFLALYAKACRSKIVPGPKSFAKGAWTPAPSAYAVPSSVKPTVRKFTETRHDPNLIVFLADCHLGSESTMTDPAKKEEVRTNLENFKKTADMILAMKPLPGTVLILGDLAFAKGEREGYLAAAPLLTQLEKAGIHWQLCPGESDRRETLLNAFPRLKNLANEVPNRLTQVVSTPRTDFLLLDSLEEGQPGGKLDAAQRQWLEKKIQQYRTSGRRFFIVSHHPAKELGILPLLKGVSSCCGCLNAHENSWKLMKEENLQLIGMPSTTYPAAGKPTRHGYSYLKTDAWEYILRTVTFDQDDVWERQPRVIRFPRVNTPFRAGAAAVDISPTKFPVTVNGGFTPRYYNKLNDPLHARAIVVDNGTEKFALATIDTCLFRSSFADQIKKIVHEKSGFPVERISISATHTHYTPALTFTNRVAADDDYTTYVQEKTAQAILQAIKNLQPAKVGFIQAREPRHVFCRRCIMKPGKAVTVNPAFTDSKGDIAQMNPRKGSEDIVTRTGFPDQNIYILSFKTKDDKPLALLANYSTHYAGGVNEVSADYFGVFARRISELINAPPSFVAMMTNGTSGDTNCSNFLDKNQPKYDLNIVGEDVAQSVFKVYQKIEYKEKVVVKAKEESLTLGVRLATPEQVAEAKAWMAKLNDQKKEPSTMTDVYALRTIQLEQAAPTRTIKLQAFRIDNIGFCSIPCEVFSFTGHDLRANTPLASHFVISLANGYNGYLPTTEQFELGGYTTWRPTSSLEKTAEPKIRAKILQMLEEFAK